jgi:hypothetical protein
VSLFAARRAVKQQKVRGQRREVRDRPPRVRVTRDVLVASGSARESNHMGVSDKQAVVAVNVPLFLGSVFFSFALIATLSDGCGLRHGLDAAVLALFIATPVLSVLAGRSRRRVPTVFLAVPAAIGSALELAWVFNTAYSVLWFSQAKPQDTDYLGLFLLFLYGCFLVANAALMLLVCVTRRRRVDQPG